MDFQIPFPPFSSSYEDLSDPENGFVNYFTMIQAHHIQNVMKEAYPGPGPTGYGASLFLSRILKVKQTFVSDRVLAKRLSENATYRSICGFKKNQTPSHSTYTTLRGHLGIEGYRAIHRNFVFECDKLGLLNLHLPHLPKNAHKGLILIGDSTPIRAYCSTKGTQQPDGSWLFTDPSVSFGRPHHRDKYPVGHKAHSLITPTGIPLVSVVTSRNKSDQDHILPLLQQLKQRFPELSCAYLILDAGYDAEHIHQGIFEDYGIIPIIVRKKLTYPKGFTNNGIPLCPLGYKMIKAVVDHKRRRTKYVCNKICKSKQQKTLEFCSHLKSDKVHGLVTYTRFKDGYRKFGPATPNSIIYKRLKPLRTAIERKYGLVKENRYRMEWTNTYMGIDNVTMHVIEHDIALTLDIMFEYKKKGKLSPLLKLKC
jgi:IS5 family transposase